MSMLLQPLRLVSSEELAPQTNLFAQWDAAETYVTKSGANLVSQWNDRSGNARHMTQATGTKQPLWTPSVLNGRASIQGDGIDDYLQATFTLSGPYSVYFVCKRSSSVDGEAIWSGKNDTNFYGKERGAGAPNDLMLSSTNAVLTLTLATWCIGGFATTSGSTRYKKNLNAGASDSNGVASAVGGFTAFSRGGNLTLASAVAFTEILLYNVQHTAAQMTEVHTYLNNKYAIV